MKVWFEFHKEYIFLWFLSALMGEIMMFFLKRALNIHNVRISYTINLGKIHLMDISMIKIIKFHFMKIHM